MKNYLRAYKFFPLVVVGAGIFYSSLSGAMFLVSHNESEEVITVHRTRKVFLKETFPLWWTVKHQTDAVRLLDNTNLRLMVMGPEEEDTRAHSGKDKIQGKSFGFSFPTRSPWCLLATKYIEQSSRATQKHVCVGDWGAGYGFFSRHVLMAGGSPRLLEQIREVAIEANTKIMVTAKPFLPKGQLLKDSYRVTVGLVECPPKRFLDRKNDLNVVFNVLHYLNPVQVQACMKNVFQNTLPGGFAIFVVETPFTLTARNSINLDYYNANKLKGEEFPGFGVYTVSFIEVAEGSISMPRSVYKPTAEEMEQNKFPMGARFRGHCHDRGTHGEDDGRTLSGNPALKESDPQNVLKMSNIPYTYSTFHETYNLMDCEDLSRHVETNGFRVINAFYADWFGDTLYSEEEGRTKEVVLGKYQRSRAVVIGQRATGAKVGRAD